jgi:hypothetical protein
MRLKGIDELSLEDLTTVAKDERFNRIDSQKKSKKRKVKNPFVLKPGLFDHFFSGAIFSSHYSSSVDELIYERDALDLGVYEPEVILDGAILISSMEEDED